MSVTLIFHLEQADDEIVWWAESPDAPGMSAAADTLVECRRLAIESLRFSDVAFERITELLAEATMDTGSAVRSLAFA